MVEWLLTAIEHTKTAMVTLAPHVSEGLTTFIIENITHLITHNVFISGRRKSLGLTSQYAT